MRPKNSSTLVALCMCLLVTTIAQLQPSASESREVRVLDGLWDFRADISPDRNQGFTEKWFQLRLSQTGSVIPMPVPSSYNDIGVSAELRDFVGWAWYDTSFFVSSDWLDGRRIVLRFGSVHYNAIVWLNGQYAMSHSGGNLPFEAEISKLLLPAQENWVTVAVNNTLSPTTLPPGTIQYMDDPNKYLPGYFVQNVQMDFFNYAGIHRPVLLYTTPAVFIQDITVQTSFLETMGIMNYNITVAGGAPSDVSINLFGSQLKVATATSLSGVVYIKNVQLWWPYTMNNGSNAYLYDFEIIITSSVGKDIYRLPVGIRTVNVTNKQLLINNKPFYCMGVDKHEDSDIRGRGFDLAVAVRDFNLLKWLGANCFRTSHYPYAEDVMDLTDKLGIVVIDESPGVGIKKDNMGNDSLIHHLQVMGELVQRDKNRPSVIMWSAANEPQSYEPEANFYFKTILDYTRKLDSTRPVTFVIGPSDFDKDQAAQYVDVLCINRYYSWYSDIGHTEVVSRQLSYDLNNWHQKYNKPVIMSEYGADTLVGLHSLPSAAFTEDYQVDFSLAYHQVFDVLRNDFLVGELVWNFADFMTVQGVTRVVGNHKGLFTRQRQPKPAAYVIRARYMSVTGG